jgi:hypothetical protein
MYYGSTLAATTFTEPMMRSLPVRIIRSVLFFVPSANPDVEKLYPRVKKWILEVSEDGWPQREIGLDENALPLFRLPNERNSGFWTDMARTKFMRSDLVLIDADEFEKCWAHAASTSEAVA